MRDILEVENISKTFGGAKAVDRCTFTIKRNSISGLIGPNGAGKTTVFNLISGLLRTDEGTIYFNDKDITNLSPHKRTKLGLGRSYQAIRLFPELTALENIMIAFEENQEKLRHVFTPYKKKQNRLRKKAMDLLENVGLEEKSNLKAYELSYGQKKLLEVLRAKANDSQLILLDEPTAGINPTMIKQVTKVIKDFIKEGRTVLIVEHNMPFMMSLCETIICMDNGREIAIGKPKEIQENPDVLEAYLGRKK